MPFCQLSIQVQKIQIQRTIQGYRDLLVVSIKAIVEIREMGQVFLEQMCVGIYDRRAK